MLTGKNRTLKILFSINQVTDSLNNVKTAAEETGAARKYGMGAEY